MALYAFNYGISVPSLMCWPFDMTQMGTIENIESMIQQKALIY